MVDNQFTSNDIGYLITNNVYLGAFVDSDGMQTSDLKIRNIIFKPLPSGGALINAPANEGAGTIINNSGSAATGSLEGNNINNAWE